ncbi:MAG: inositol monophosphatase family protein [Acidimicrobiales bacterium]
MRFWTVDPVDGTKSLLRGLPHYGFLVAVCDLEGPIAAGITAPALECRWLAA